MYTGLRLRQLILNAGSPLEGNQITLRYFILVSPFLFCAVLCVFCSLLTCIPSLSVFLRSFSRLFILHPDWSTRAGQGEPARPAAAPQASPFHRLPSAPYPGAFPLPLRLKLAGGMPSLSFFYSFCLFFLAPWCDCH